MDRGGVIYLDNAATSWPKPAQVGEAMAVFLERHAGNPGRGGHRLAREAAEVVEGARSRLAALVGAADPRRLILTHGCTDSVNMAIHGTLGAAMRGVCKDGTKPHVVMSAVEHNAVLRTVYCYTHGGANDNTIDVTVVPCDGVGRVDPDEMLAACDERTRLVCLSSASNALGTIQDVASVGTRLRERAPDALFLVDAAQTVGHAEVDVEAAGIDLLAIAGHKGLRGPTATGGLYVGPRAYPEDGPARLFCQRRGGTGIAAPGTEMPTELPDALEAGTCNAVGMAGLIAAMDARRPDDHEREHAAAETLLTGLQAIEGVTVYGLPTMEGRTSVVLFNVEGVHPRELMDRLDREHGIAVRGGTHCAPLLHEAIGTAPDGAVRASVGVETLPEEICQFLAAICEASPSRELVPI